MESRQLSLIMIISFGVLMAFAVADAFACIGVCWLYGDENIQGITAHVHFYPNRLCVDASYSGYKIHQCQKKKDICDSESSVATVRAIRDSDDKGCNAMKRSEGSQAMFALCGAAGIAALALGVLDYFMGGKYRFMMLSTFVALACMVITAIIAGALEFSACHDINKEIKDSGSDALGYSDGSATFIVTCVGCLGAIVAYIVLVIMRGKSGDSAERAPLTH